MEIENKQFQPTVLRPLAGLEPQLIWHVGQRVVAQHIAAADILGVVVHQVGEPHARQDLSREDLLHAFFEAAEAKRLARLDVEDPHAKNNQEAEIPLREDLAGELRDWVGEEAAPSQPLFDVPRQLVKTLDRDLKVAGILKRDDRGRTIDVHALRHSFGSLLSAGGVAPRTAQAAMRHSSIDLTMNVYTDPRVLDVAGAMEALPAMPPVGGEAPLAPMLASNSGDGG